MSASPTPKNAAKRRGIFLIDDHAILRAGLRRLLEAEPDFKVCGESESGQKAISRIRASRPDLVIVDISLPGTNGIELIKRLRSQFADLPMLVLSMHDENLYAERALRAGARGYVMKQAPTEQLLAAIRQVLNRGIHVSEGLSAQLLHSLVSAKAAPRNSLEILSDRELEVVQMMGKGLSTGEVARELGISAKTVETHRGNIRQKLHLRTGAELVRFALAHCTERM